MFHLEHVSKQRGDTRVMTQQVYSIGAPLHCGELECSGEAIVQLRQENGDGTVDRLTYCEKHWAAILREAQALPRAASLLPTPYEPQSVSQTVIVQL